MKTYDLIILGAGPAGLTAALYSARAGLKTAVISKDIGGTANSILLLENWPGFHGKGAHLMKQFYDQVKGYDVEFFMEEIDCIEKSKEDKDEFRICTKKQDFHSKAVIIATGTDRRKLNVPGEKELTGKGVSYCVTCDAFFFKGKTVAVVGGSDCAATSALALSDLVKKVYVIYRGEKLRCEDVTQTRLDNKENVEIIYNAVPRRILGQDEDSVTGIDLEVSGKNKELKVDGIFVEIGAEPITTVLEKAHIKLSKDNYIVVDENMKTSVEGIFACGDVTNQKLKQVIVASSQGAIAAKNAYEYVSKKN